MFQGVGSVIMHPKLVELGGMACSYKSDHQRVLEKCPLQILGPVEVGIAWTF
jgi:hypothetical protein